jgi:hypothetical protein
LRGKEDKGGERERKREAKGMDRVLERRRGRAISHSETKILHTGLWAPQFLLNMAPTFVYPALIWYESYPIDCKIGQFVQYVGHRAEE